LVVLAHLRRRWSLSGRDGFGALSPFGAFMKVKCVFSTTLEAKNFSKLLWMKMEVNGGHW
jgi:hypothetical protein